MLALVLGGAASGKSEYAEQLAVSLSSQRYYIATMQVDDAESERRICRHRQMRAGKGFHTVERALDLAGLDLYCPGAAALLECASTLLGNELYLTGGAGVNAPDAIMAGIERLLAEGLDVVVVSNDVLSAGAPCTPEMRTYITALGRLNCLIAAAADCVVEVCCGLPIYHKRKAEDFGV